MFELYKKMTDIIAKDKISKEEAKNILKEYANLNNSEQEKLSSEMKNIKEIIEKQSDIKSLDEKETKDDNEIESQVEKMIGSIVEREVSTLKQDVKSYVKEQTERDKKMVDFQSRNNKRSQYNELSKTMRKVCQKALKGETVVIKEMSTDDTASPYGGYAVDSELSAEIRHLKTEYGVASREMTPIRLSKHTYRANELVTDITTYWVDEEDPISSSQIVLGQNTLELKKLATIVSISSELIEDEEIDLFAHITSRVAEGFAEKEDNAFFNGDGTSAYGGFTGLLNSTNVNTTTMAGSTFKSIDGNDLITMMSDTPSGAYPNAKFYMHRSIFNTLRGARTTTNDYVFQKPSEGGPTTCWGFPVVLVEVMPTISDTAPETPFVIFGDLKKGCLLGYKAGLQIERSNSAIIRNVADSEDINTFTGDRKAIRFLQRVGFVQQIQNLKIPITVLATGTVSA